MMKSTTNTPGRLLLILLMAACLLLLAACGQKTAELPVKPCESVAAAIAEGQAFEELTAQDMREIVAYLEVKEDDLTDAALWTDASAATVEMIAVLTAKDGAALERIREEMKLFLTDITEIYRDYVPEEIPKLEGVVMETQGLQLVLILSKDSAAARATLNAAWQ